MASTPEPSAPRHILSLTTQEQRQFLESFDRVFSDIDGVVWNLHSKIEGSPEGFNALKQAGKRVQFVTNNSVRTAEMCVQKFKDVNMTVEPLDIWHPAQSMVHYLQGIKFEGLIYAIAAEPFKRILREAGYQVIDGPTKILGESTAELGRHVFDREPVRAVVIDVDFNLSWAKMIRAQLYLQRPECKLLVGATDTQLPVRKDINILGPGAFAKVLDDASPQPAITLGKPGRELAALLIEQAGIKDPQRTLMVGDMMEQDIGFGRLCGFQTLLVLSGGCALADLQAQRDPRYQPDYYADSMADILALVNSMGKAHV